MILYRYCARVLLVEKKKKVCEGGSGGSVLCSVCCALCGRRSARASVVGRSFGAGVV